MHSLAELEQLLKTQFGPFIRDSRYKEAFDRAMQSMQTLDLEEATIDVFYLFLHHLIIELFDEIDRLRTQLRST